MPCLEEALRTQIEEEMPVGALLLNKDVKVKRSPSLRSESNQSSLSDSRHVSFNQDVSIKRIPKKIVKVKSLDPNDEFQQKCHQFVNIPPPSDKEQIEDEAQQILQQLEEIECSVSPSPRITSPVRQLVSPSPRPDGSRQGTPVGSRQSTLERGRGTKLLGRLSKSSSDLVARSTNRLRGMRVEGTSEQEDSPGPGPDSRFYGLQALSNLDNAVNGKVNNLYRDSSGSIDYSPPPKKNNLTPPKPPRKAPSASPPSIRKGYASHDELELRTKSRNEMYEHNQKRDWENEGGFSYANANPSLNHLRESPTRLMNSRQSPSRGNHTDTEILSSPTQVLYATISADKHKHSGNLKNQHIQTQTVQSGFRPISAERPIKPWASSKENILDDPPYRFSNNATSKHASRSLERFVDDDKENIRRNQELKARIHVSSPMRYTADRPATGSRKPYKTTINTATDTIQYRGFSSENLVDKNDPRYKQKNLARHSGKKQDTEHYKVPKNKAPVPAEFIGRKGRTVSENPPSAYNGNHHASEKNPKSQFASTSLVRNAVSESRVKRGEYDREGRRIHSSGRSGERNRAYSGYSTSPDREMSPDRYSKPRPARMASPRSPSSSPQRPPRSRASPQREIIVPIRQEHTGREVERSPSTRAAATSRSPIKKIQRVHNEIKGDKLVGGREASPNKTKTLTLTRSKGETGGGVRGVKSIFMKKQENNEDDRLSKFTEYRGGGGGGGEEPVAPTRSQSGGRRGSTGYELRKEHSSGEGERERGQSVPPGANIDSMRDFYKTNQYRSMYHLPPSPSRPAPVLDRSGKTLERPGLRREQTAEFVMPPPRRHAKTSVSEGELTDDQARADRVQRQRSKFLNNMMTKGEQGGGQGQGTLNRRIASNDRESSEARRVIRAANGEVLNNHRNGSHERPVRRQAPPPPIAPTQRVRRSSVEVLETSHSESESPRPEQAKLASETGRWAGGHSDIEADYRQQMATNSVHIEARGRSGEVNPQVPSIYQQAATLNRNKSASKTQVDSSARGKSHERSTREVEISQDDDEDEIVRAPTREDERRKIIELEEERRRKEMKSSGNVSRSGSRVSKTLGSKLKGSRIGGGETETDAQSQYSGHSAPNLNKSRYNSNTRIKRTGSGANTNSARQIISRKKMPGSLTSSINSSESENGQSAISRATGTSAASNRSVFLHATAVADIPSNKSGEKGAAPASNLQKSKKISRSISLLAPFKKNQGSIKEKEVMYDSTGQVVSGGGKPPRPPPAPVRRLNSGESSITREKKFASSSDLLQDENEVVMAHPQQDNAKNSSRVSRSVSMPKDTRLAGWFKKRKRV